MRRHLLAAVVAPSLCLAASGARATDRLHRQMHMTAASAAKCKAYAQVVSDTRSLQASGGGAFDAGTRRRLEAELRRAKAMPPSALSPSRCGVPL